MTGTPRLFILTVGFGIGGAERLIATTAPKLRDRGFEVTVAALEAWGPIADLLMKEGVPCIALGARGRQDPFAWMRLHAHLRSLRPDILHAHLFRANVAARVVGRLAGVPVIITAHHDTDIPMRRIHRMTERLTARLSDQTVACSEAVRRFAIDDLGLAADGVTTLRNAIPLPPAGVDPGARARIRAGFGAGPEDRLIGYVGRLIEPKKGLATLIKAVPEVLASVPRVRFVLVGDGPARLHLETLAREAGLGGALLFVGERQDISEVMPAFDLFVQPSLWEGFGLTVLEAMAAGLPVVASEVGGIPEILRHGREGLLVPAGDAKALAAALVRVLRDETQAAEWGHAGRARVESEFGLDALLSSTVRLYREMLEHRGVAGRTDRGGTQGMAA